MVGVVKGLHTHLRVHIHLKPLTPNKGPPHPIKARITHPWPPDYSLALYTHSRPSTPVLGSPHPPQTLHTHPTPSIPPYVIQISSRSPSTPIPTHSHSSEALWEPSWAKKDAPTPRETPPPGPGEGVGGGVNPSPKGKKWVGREEEGRAKPLTP